MTSGHLEKHVARLDRRDEAVVFGGDLVAAEKLEATLLLLIHAVGIAAGGADAAGDAGCAAAELEEAGLEGRIVDVATAVGVFRDLANVLVVRREFSLFIEPSRTSRKPKKCFTRPVLASSDIVVNDCRSDSDSLQPTYDVTDANKARRVAWLRKVIGSAPE